MEKLIKDLQTLAEGKECLVPFQLHPIMLRLLSIGEAQLNDAFDHSSTPLEARAKKCLERLNQYETERGDQT